MTVSEAYNLWGKDPRWSRLARDGRHVMVCTLLRRYGDRDLNDLDPERLSTWLSTGCQPIERKVQARSIVGHLVRWAAEEGLYAGDATAFGTVVRYTPRPAPVVTSEEPAAAVAAPHKGSLGNKASHARSAATPLSSRSASAVIVCRRRPNRVYSGTIYSELHNRGRRSSGSADGNRSSVRMVRGVGMVHAYGYRWVAEITYRRHRYRCRSHSFSRVREWLDGMCARFND